MSNDKAESLTTPQSTTQPPTHLPNRPSNSFQDLSLTPDQLEISRSLTTVRDYIRWSFTQFESQTGERALCYGHGTENAWDEAVALVFSALRLPWDIAERDKGVLEAKLTVTERIQIIDWVEQRVTQRLPLPYITGEAWFFGIPFYVNPNVLIPRSPIAELIERYFEPWWDQDRPAARILDLCTGSGALAVALAQAFPDAVVDAIDLSPEALSVAQQNVERYHLQDQIRLIESDLFTALPQPGSEGAVQYDIMVSNPPYVGADEMAELPEEFKHEPAMALEADRNGLAIVDTILARAKQFLTPNGLLVVEVGNTEVLMEEAYAHLPLTWVEFEHGGYGVFVIRAADLL